MDSLKYEDYIPIDMSITKWSSLWPTSTLFWELTDYIKLDQIVLKINQILYYWVEAWFGDTAWKDRDNIPLEKENIENIQSTTILRENYLKIVVLFIRSDAKVKLKTSKLQGK